MIGTPEERQKWVFEVHRDYFKDPCTHHPPPVLLLHGCAGTGKSAAISCIVDGHHAWDDLHTSSVLSWCVDGDGDPHFPMSPPHPALAMDQQRRQKDEDLADERLPCLVAPTEETNEWTGVAGAMV